MPPFFKDFSRTTFDFQGPPTRNIISQIVQECTFPASFYETLRPKLCFLHQLLYIFQFTCLRNRTIHTYQTRQSNDIHLANSKLKLGASSSDLNNVPAFLDRCYEVKCRYISRKLNIRELPERSDCRIFRKVLRTNSPIVKILPERNFTNHALRKPCFYHPIVAKECFKSSYMNRLIFGSDINSLM